MADKYRNYAELARRETPDSFTVRLRSSGSAVVVVAPHGGAIEPGTSEIALAIAADDLSYYLFEGLKSRANRDLHLTSNGFDEPRCLELLESAVTVITVHGERSDDRIVHIGGLDLATGRSVGEELRRAGFTVGLHDHPRLHGRDAANLANRGSRGAGVQLELSRGLRAELFAALTREGRRRPTPRLAAFRDAVRAALAGPA